MREEKKIVIIAGPNGAGKTTFAQEYLPHEAGCPIFINADLIAAGLSPFQPEKSALKAGRLMLKEINENVQRGVSFAFETTLSGLLYTRMIPEWQKLGYRVKLIYLSLSNIDMALARITARVMKGGHDVPPDVVRRRFESGLTNFHTIYKNLVDIWIHYDNSKESPILLAQEEKSWKIR